MKSMETNQNQPANGLPGTGKPGVEGAGRAGVESAGAGKLDLSALQVFDQLLKATIDHVLSAEDRVRENTGQLRVMASSVELVRGVPNKMDKLAQTVAEMEKRVGFFEDSMTKLCARIEAFEQTTVQKLGERLDGVEYAMRQLTLKRFELEKATEGLCVEMRKHAELFEKPQERRVYHRHYLHWYAWIIVGVSVVGIGFGLLWCNASDEAGRNAGNDILWRGAMQVPDSAFHAGLINLKYQCDTNAVQFRHGVEEDEANDAELERKLKEQNLKQQEADEKKTEADEKQREANAERQENEELKRQKGKR